MNTKHRWRWRVPIRLFLARLLSRVCGFEVPEVVSARAHSEDIQVTVPATYHADSITVFSNEAGADVLAVVLEVQRRWDEAKWATWRLYLAHTEVTYQVGAALLVYCPDPGVGRRYREFFAECGISLRVHPFVVTPEQIPMVTDVAEAERDPTLAVLSALAHSRDPSAGFPALEAALRAADPRRRLAYHDIVLAGFPPSARSDWRTFMSTTEFKSRWLSEEFREAEARGIEQGIEHERANLILKALAARGIPLTDEVRERVTSTKDLDLLGVWVERALTADAASDVFGNGDA